MFSDVYSQASVFAFAGMLVQSHAVVSVLLAKEKWTNKHTLKNILCI